MAGLLGDVLPYVYSRGNALTRALGGLLSDPVGSAQQTIGLLNDKAREYEGTQAQAFADPRNPLKVTNPGALNRMTEMMMSGAAGFAPAGMVAYHGSPAVFDKFSRDKIGSGRGLEQGWGVYLTDAERVARSNGGNVYKVDVPDEAVARMLQWQEPVSTQARPVREGLLKALGPKGYKIAAKYGATGSDVYNGSLAGLPQQEASELLNAAGIPGIRYGGNGATNTVVFDPEIARILGF